MKKITILTLHLGYGGIEKCISTFVNNMANEYDITIVSTYKLYPKSPYEINDKVKIKYLIEEDIAIKVDLYKQLLFKLKFVELFKTLYKDYFKKLKFISFFKDIFKSIKIIFKKRSLMINYIKNSNSDVYVSTRNLQSYLLSKYGKKNSIKIGWEHSHHCNNKKYINKTVKSVKNLDYFVLVSDSLKKFYQERLKDFNCKCLYISNSLDEISSTSSNLKNKNIISVGRIAKEKGYEDLIDVFQIVNKKYPDWKLHIIGDGPYNDKVQQKIEENKLNNYVILYGFQDKKYINNKLLKSSIYVMTSFTESFGLALVEAMSYGIPCLAFDSAEGANDIISNNKNGFLITDRNKQEMANKIINLIEDFDLRKHLGESAKKTAYKYDPLKIKKEWIKLINKKI